MTITANRQQALGAPDPTFSVSATGFVNGDNVGALGGTAGVYHQRAHDRLRPTGNYIITPAGLTSGNYAITFVPGTLAVMPAPTTVTLSPLINFLAYGQPLTLTATVIPQFAKHCHTQRRHGHLLRRWR